MKVYSRTKGTADPEALEREATNKSQRDINENTLMWGEDNALPLRIAKSIEESPAASSCIETITKFVRGAKFSDPDLMKVVVDKNGTTLWELHCKLASQIAWIRSFAVNLKFSGTGRITQAYHMATENSRFVKPDDDLATNITLLKYNPYFGTSEYHKKYTKEYHLWDQEEVTKQIRSEGTKFRGQVYFWGETSPLSKFYPKPKYWSAKKWIYIDGKIQEGHAENMDNGFFQSVVMTMIGDPAQKSKNPAYMKKISNADGTTTLVPDKTVGEEFDDMMSTTFSGTKKMGSALVLWALTAALTPNVQAFPSSTNADLFTVLQDLTTKNITIGMNVPGILANINEGVSLGSDGNEMQKAVELMQSNTADWRTKLEDFYNNILIPNCEFKGIKSKSKVEIVNYNPITVPVEIDDKFWQVLNDQEKRNFVRKNFSNIELEEQPQTDSEGNALPPGEIQINDNITKLTGRQQEQFIRILRQFGQGKLNEEAAKIQLKGFAFTDEEIRKILGLDEVDQTTADTAQQPATP